MEMIKIKKDLHAVVEIMSNEQAGELLKAIFRHVSNKDTDVLDNSVKMVFETIRSDLDSHINKYNEIIAKRSYAGKKSAEMRKNTHEISTHVNTCQHVLKKDTQKPTKNKKPPISEREQDFINQTNQFVQYDKSMLDNFINYWCEKNQSGDKMKFEMQKTFEISKRLITWYNRGTQNTFNTKQKSAFSRESDFN